MTESRLLASLSYTGILAIALLFMERDGFISFHLRQGLLILVGLIVSIFLALLDARAGNTLFLVFLILDIVGLVYALTGQEKSLPAIGKMAQLLNWIK